MKIVVCVRQSAAGELNPFDACAYEAALSIPLADVTLLSMGPPSVEGFLKSLTRLGAKQAILLTDRAFAGADTLATAYTLSLAIAKLQPDMVFCGRQTVDGDTGQVGPALSVLTGYSLIPNVMSIRAESDRVVCTDRAGETVERSYPTLLTVERINTLRLPSLRSRESDVMVWDATAIQADLNRCGLSGSPTRVVKTFENEQDRRHCTFIKPSELQAVIQQGLQKGKERVAPVEVCESRLPRVWIVGEAPREMANTISDDITVIEPDTPERMAEQIRNGNPEAVLWGSDRLSKALAPQVATLLQTGLCADCTALETDGENLFMYRPAFSGSIIAKIRCTTRPQMATVRTLQTDVAPIVVGLGMGAKGCVDRAKSFAETLQAELAASRLMVDHDYLPYELQVGLTGKTVNPDVYLALGISGAVHHIAGMRQSGTVIAVNNDPKAPIFKFADYGIVCNVEDIL